MSIASEIQRLQTAKAGIKQSLEEKGVVVDDNLSISNYGQLIHESEFGGGDYDQGYEDGKKSVVQLDRIARSITFISLNDFGKKEVELNFDNLTTLGNLFQMSSAENENKTVERLTINMANKPSSVSQMLYCHSSASDDTLKHLTFNVDTQNCTSFNHTFTYQRALEIIDGMPLNFSSVTSASNMNCFNNCLALVDVRVVANSIKLNFSVQHSPNLSTDTIQSIIDGLADLTGGTAQTLTVHADVGGKLTDTQKATITAKNWTLVY